MAGIGDSWGTREELLHPRDSHGRFRTKWKMSPAVLAAVLRITENFRPRTFQSDGQATQYTQNLAHKKPERFQGGRGYARLQADFFNANEDLLDGNPDEPSTKKFVQMMDASMIDIPEDIIASQIVPPSAFGLTPDRLPELEEMTGNVIANRGYGAANLGTPLGGGNGLITMSIATPKGTKMAFPGRSPNDRAAFYNRDQELTITKVKPDGRGGYYVWAVATPATPGENPAPQGTGHAGPGKPADREAAVTGLENAAMKRAMGEQGASQLPGGEAAGGLPENPNGTINRDAATERATRRAQVLGRPAAQEPTPSQPQPEQATPPAPAAPAAPSTPTTPPAAATPNVPETPTPVEAPAPSGVEPPNGATALVTGNPAVSFREAVGDADLAAPVDPARRREFNSALKDITSGKVTPQDALRNLEADIERNQAHQTDQEGFADRHLLSDIERQEKLADLIRSHFTLGQKNRKARADVVKDLDQKAVAKVKERTRPAGGRDREPGEPSAIEQRAAPTGRLAKDAEARTEPQPERQAKLATQREKDLEDDKLNAAQRKEWSQEVGPEPKKMTAGDVLLDEQADLLRNGRTTKAKAATRLREQARDDATPEAEYLRKVADAIEANETPLPKRVPVKKVAKATPDTEKAEASLAGRTDRNILTGLNALSVGDMRAVADKWGVATRSDDKKLKLKSALAKELAAHWKANPDLQRKAEIPEGTPEVSLDKMTIAQLKEHAAVNGIKLPSGLLKRQILGRIRGEEDNKANPKAPATAEEALKQAGEPELAPEDLKAPVKKAAAKAVKVAKKAAPSAPEEPATPEAKALATVAETPGVPAALKKAAKKAATSVAPKKTATQIKRESLERIVTEHQAGAGGDDTAADFGEIADKVRSGAWGKLQARQAAKRAERKWQSEVTKAVHAKDSAAADRAEHNAAQFQTLADAIQISDSQIAVDAGRRAERVAGVPAAPPAPVKKTVAEAEKAVTGPGLTDAEHEESLRGDVQVQTEEIRKLERRLNDTEPGTEDADDIQQQLDAAHDGENEARDALEQFRQAKTITKAAPVKAAKKAAKKLTPAAVAEVRQEVEATKGPAKVSVEDRVAAHLLGRIGEIDPAMQQRVLADMPEADRKHVVETAERVTQERTRVKTGGLNLDEILDTTGARVPNDFGDKAQADAVRKLLSDNKVPDAKRRLTTMIRTNESSLASIDKELKASDLTQAERDSLTRSREQRLESLAWQRSAIEGLGIKGPSTASRQEVAQEVKQVALGRDDWEAWKGTTEEDLRTAADLQGIKLPEGPLTKDQIMTEIVRDLARKRLAGEDTTPKLPEAPAPKPEPVIPKASANITGDTMEGAGFRDTVKSLEDGDITPQTAGQQLRTHARDWRAKRDAAKKDKTLSPEARAEQAARFDDVAKQYDAQAKEVRTRKPVAKQAVIQEVLADVAAKVAGPKAPAKKLTPAAPSVPAKKAAARKLSAAQLGPMSEAEVQQAFLEGRTTKQQAAKAIRAIAQSRESHGAYIGLGDSAKRAASPEAARVDADVTRLRALASAIEETPTKRGTAPIKATLERAAAPVAPHKMTASQFDRELAQTKALASQVEGPPARVVRPGFEGSFPDQAHAGTPERQAEVETAIVQAFKRAHKKAGKTDKTDSVYISDFRKEIPAGFSREEVDAALYRMNIKPGTNVTTTPGQHTLSDADRAAGIILGNQNKTQISIREDELPKNPVEKAVEARRTAKAAQAEVAQDLSPAKAVKKVTAPEAKLPAGAHRYTEAELQEMTVPDIKGIEDERGIKFVSMARKDRIATILAQQEQAGAPAPAKKAAKAATAPAPVPAKKATKKAVKAATQEASNERSAAGIRKIAQGGFRNDEVRAGVYSDKPVLKNGWDSGTPGPVYFHASGDVGQALGSMGKDRDLEVDGDRLQNVLGKLATRQVSGEITGDEFVDQVKKLAARMPAGSKARSGLEDIVKKTDTPKVQIKTFGAPPFLENLAKAIEAIPLARSPLRSGDPGEAEMLETILRKLKNGDPEVASPMRLDRALTELSNRRHESQEGKVQLDRAVAAAIKELDDIRRNPSRKAEKVALSRVS